MSQYIANLNALPTAHDIASQHNDRFGLEDDLTLFTNTEFFDFDLGDDLESPAVGYSPSQEERARRVNASAPKNVLKGLGFSDSNGICVCDGIFFSFLNNASLIFSVP